MELFQRLFEGSLMPHGHCLLWRADLLALHVSGDVLTTLAYFIIPLALIHLVRKRVDLAFNWIFLLFAGFILFCGITHLIALINIWHGYYFLEGLAKLLTGLISMVTAVMIWKLMPHALALPSGADLLIKNKELEIVKTRLSESNQLLEQRVYERTRQLEQMAVTDPLTNIANRGEIMRQLDEELERARRYNHPLCILMIDLDNFKSINDGYGHLIGDEVIIHAAKTLESLCRSSDSVGRYGGEEFIVVLPETDRQAATALAERMRQEISQHQVHYEKDETISYTCSIGVSEMSSDINKKALLQTADKALYKAKFNGRNRVVNDI